MSFNLNLKLNMGVRTASAISSPSVFSSPTDISNLAVWYDPSDTGSITESSGSVSQLNDKSGANNHATQGTADKQPTTGVTTLNSLNTLGYDSDYLTIPNGVLASGTGARTVIMVGRATSTTGNRFMFSQGATGGKRWTLKWDGGSPRPLRAEIEGSGYTSSLTIANNTWAIVGMRFDGTRLQDNMLFKDGATEQATGTGTLDTTNDGGNSRLGSWASGTNEWIGGIAEFAYYTKALSDSELNDLGNYLADKWAQTWSDIT